MRLRNCCRGQARNVPEGHVAGSLGYKDSKKGSSARGQYKNRAELRHITDHSFIGPLRLITLQSRSKIAQAASADMSALGQNRTSALRKAMSALLSKADIGSTSDEHSDAWQDKPDLGELARVRIIEVQRTWPTARNHARARPCRDWGNCRRTGETVDLIPTVPHHFHLGIELVL